jgi:hypothetical protein
VTRSDLQLVYSVADRVQTHWQVDERKDKTPLGATIDQKAIDGFWASLSNSRLATNPYCRLSGIQ